MTKGVKSLIISFSVLAFLFTVGITTLRSPVFQRYLLSIIEKRSGWKINFSDSRINFLRGIVVLYNPSAANREGKFHVAANHLLVDLSSLSAIRGKLIVTNIEIDKPTLLIESSQKKNEMISPNTIQEVFEKFEKSFFLKNVILDHVLIQNLSVIPSQGKPFSLKRAVIKILPTFFQEASLEALLEKGEGVFSFNTFDLALVIARNGFKLKNLQLDLPKLQLTLKGQGNGNLEKGSLTLEGTLSTPTVLSDILKFNLSASLDKKLATLKKIEAHLGQASLMGKGTFNLQKLNYDIPFTAKDLPLEAIFQKLNTAVLKPAKGTALVEGRALGQLPHLKIDAKATIENLEHGLIRVKKAWGTIGLDWPSLDWNASVQQGDTRTQSVVKGGVLFKHIEGYEKLQTQLKPLDIQFEDTSLAELLPSLTMSGKLRGNLHLESAKQILVQGNAKMEVSGGHWFFGPVDSLTTEITFRPGGEIIFNKTAFKLPSFLPIQWSGAITLQTLEEGIIFSGTPTDAISFKGSYRKETGPFQINTIQIHQGNHRLQGNFTLFSDERISGHAKGSFNLGWLNYFPAFFRDENGETRLDLSFSGTSKNPLIQGQIDFLGDELALRGFSGQVSDLRGKLKINGSTIFPNLSGMLGDGEFKLDGHFTLNQWKPEDFDIAFKGRNLTLARPNIFRIDFDTEVLLKGRLPTPLLAGRIDIVDGRYIKKFILRDFVLKPFEEPTEPAPWEESLKPLRLDLKIKNSGDMKIKNNVADFFLQTDLRVGGTFGQPRITGAVTTTEGTFYLLGTNFTLTEGRLEFLDPFQQEPYLTLMAQAAENSGIPSNYSVFVEIKGYLSNLDVTLSSNPALPREDIISLITLGLTQEEIRQRGQSKRSLSSGILASEITGILERPIAKSTGLDIFRLEASESGSISRLALGKNLTDRLTLEFMNDIDPKTAERIVQANYSLTDNVILKGNRSWTASTIPKYQFNILLRFRLD